MILPAFLAILALQAAPQPTLAHVLRSSELVAYGRVLRIETRALESADGKTVRVRHGVKEARLAELEILDTLKGESAPKKLWLLAQSDNAGYDFELSEPGAQALCFLTRGEDPTPEGCTYIAGTLEIVWRCGLGRSGFATYVESNGVRTLSAPAFRFEPGDGALATAARVECKPLEARIRALALEQRASWLTASASGGIDGFPWQLLVRLDRTATLTIQRAQGPEPHEIWISNPIMNDIADKLAADAPAQPTLELGVAKERGLVRGVQLQGGIELKLLTLEREWLDDPAHKKLARWALQLYASVRSGIKEPGLLDGRKEDRDALR